VIYSAQQSYLETLQLWPKQFITETPKHPIRDDNDQLFVNMNRKMYISESEESLSPIEEI
jgi:hypothetical protein